MTFAEIENVFNRALRYSFTKMKFVFVLPVVLVCGLLIVFCRALAVNANSWLSLSLAFLPVFLCSGVLLSAGVILVRLYYHEVKGHKVDYKRLFSQSVQVLVGISYLTLPLMLSYLLLWTLMGVFYLMREIPTVGPVLATLFSFAPFLLVFGSIVLSVGCLVALFFVTPEVALKNGVSMKLAEDVYKRMKASVFSNLILFLIGTLPVALCVGVLIGSAVMTGANYLQGVDVLSVGLQWFFIMVPFCAILTPAILFFFNFATEGYALMHKKMKMEVDGEQPAGELEDAADLKESYS
ncbi:MAG: hypothetical protein S4CHLAM102_09240 [Chlamydiia bacterium]|nr:hypothetical protein [Chlamydiia bacterium]